MVKKKALQKDMYMEIRKTLNRFLSLFLINALGVAFFAGVRAAEPDMRLSADAFYDESRLMDIRVMGTLGMTEGDLQAIAQAEGVEEVMPCYSVDMFCQTPSDQITVQVMSVPDTMNRIRVKEGRLPEAEDECLVDYKLLTDGLCQIGDTITLKSGSEEETSDLVSVEKFTVVGAGTTSYYMSLDRGTTSIGSGSLNGFLVVPSSVFVQDYYTQIAVTAEGAYELTCYTDAYDSLVDTVAERIEELEGERSAIRYAQVQEEGREQIADAEAEVADGERQLADAGTELEDARIQLADAEEKLEDGRREIADGEREIADAEKELAEGRAEADDGWRKLTEAKEKLVEATIPIQNGYEEYEAGKAELDAAYAQFAPVLEEYEKLKASLEELKGGLAEIEAGLPLLEQGILTCKKEIASIDAVLSGPEGSLLPPEEREKLEGARVVLAEKERELAEEKAGMEALRTELSGKQAACETGIAELTPVVTENQAKLDAGYAALAAAKEELDAASDQVDAGNREAYYAEQELLEAEEEIKKGEQELADAKAELADGRAELRSAEAEFADAQQKLADGEAEYEEARAESEEQIADAKVKIADAKEELANLELPEWYVLDRQYIQTYVEYGSDAERIGAIGEVFPVIFFLVAALVSLTTMTRMVEEQRTQIGTLKALGYSKGSIASKYILYALLSSLLGSLIGLVLGQKILPAVIMGAYKILYNNLPVTRTPLHLGYSVTATAAAVLCTTLAAWAACYKELNAVPAELMRPAAPRAGKRVFLEQLPFLWKRLNFSRKATVRNLIRYKKRFFMTVFGIGGCMGLLLVGYGLKDSILCIGNSQFGEVFVYDGSIGMDKDAGEEEREELLSCAAEDERLLYHMEARETSLDVEAGGVTKSAYLIVPKETEKLRSYIHLQDRVSGEAYALDDEGIIISEKLAKLLGVSEGDKVLLKEDDTERTEAVVSHITEQYFQHYVYMSPALYEKLYGEAPVWNEIFLEYARTDEAQEASAGKPQQADKELEERLQKEYMAMDAVSDVTFISGTADRVANMLKSMDLIIYVLVISAGLLAFVVLYNLNNINISERKRELATLKVLGFYDGEVSAYVNRENILLTVIGAAAGVFIGIFLHRFIIVTAEIDMLMFGRIIEWKSYAYSVLLTFVFSLIVNGVMFFKLRAIDMVESLKSVE